MSKFSLYLKMLRAWMASGKGITGSTLLDFVFQTVAGLAHVDLSTDFGALVVATLEGVILGNDHHEPVTSAAGIPYPAGPASTPGQAVALALQIAEAHMEAASAHAPKQV
jgi:hypothetical protein